MSRRSLSKWFDWIRVGWKTQPEIPASVFAWFAFFTPSHNQNFPDYETYLTWKSVQFCVYHRSFSSLASKLIYWQGRESEHFSNSKIRFSTIVYRKAMKLKLLNLFFTRISITQEFWSCLFGMKKIAFSGRRLTDLRQLYRSPSVGKIWHLRRKTRRLFFSECSNFHKYIGRCGCVAGGEVPRACRRLVKWAECRASKSGPVTSSIHVEATRRVHLQDRIHRSTRCCKELDEEKNISHRK